MKTRTVRRTRLVPHTVNGITEMVLDRYEVEVPVPPRDWDRTILNAVTAAAGLLVAVAVVWSTASIGDLLARVTVAPAAYAAAVAFDLAWILCMAVEWLARYDPARAEQPRNMGHGALAVAMVAVGAHGWLAGQEAIGIIGAVVSGIVKTLWTIVLRHHAKPLDDKTQQWVDKQRAEAGGELAMVAINRELTRARGMVAAEEQVLRTDPDADPRESGQDPDNGFGSPGPNSTGPMTVKDAVRTAKAAGITDPDKVLKYVHQVADANAKAETVNRYLRMGVAC
ncbi:protein transporter Sec31 [Streptomyces sp. NPDC021622]|uniref:protein transporter Sec31 n=1 Tax=Streptomyces sp. NPDC021622 TaxID=3155013 RepID=UPI0033F0496F